MKAFTAPPPRQSRSRQASKNAATQDINGHLRANTTLAALLPTIERMQAMQAACARILPAMFTSCQVLNCTGSQLVIHTPNQALAARLRQQLPKLQSELCRQGWQIDDIRIKVRMPTTEGPSRERIKPVLPAQALPALLALENELAAESGQTPLLAALGAMIRRHHGSK